MINTEQKIQDISHIKDLAVMILSHLDKIHTKEAIGEIIELLEYTPLDNYKEIFEKVEEFRKNHGKYPDRVYLENNFSPRYYYLNWDYSSDIFIDFIFSLKKYKKIRDIQNALEDFDVDKIEDIIFKDVKIKDKDNINIDNIYDCYEKLESLPDGLILGIPELDNFIRGLDYGTMNAIAAPVSSFKTTMAISASYNACFIQKKKVLYITMEVTPEKIYYNLLARHAYEMGMDLSASDIKKAKLDENKKEIFKQVIDDFRDNIGEGNIRVLGISDIEDYSPAYLESLIKSVGDKMGGLDLVCLDYLNLLKNKIPPRMKMNDPYQALNFYAQFFTDLSIKMQFIMILLCQVSREGTAKLDKQAEKNGGVTFASTTFFAEANEVERSASCAMILHATKAMKNEGFVDIVLIKNRDGQIPELTIRARVKPDSFLLGTIDKSIVEQSMNECILAEEDGGIDVDYLNKDLENSNDINLEEELDDNR